VRLFCFPFAGGSASIYRLWSSELPEHVEVCAVQLPGRETRAKERLFTRLTPLVQALADGLSAAWTVPFAFYGHSLGARIAFELAREMRRRKAPAPAHLFVSGRRAPHIGESDPLHALNEAQLMVHLRALKGIPEAVLQEPELMAMFLPILRADFSVNEAEEYLSEPPLDCPISVFGGTEDPRCNRSQLDAWREHTQAAFSVDMLPGGHFFLQTARNRLLQLMSSTLRNSHLMKP
jgi:medium-chain acyl-[acyl-carrier-protein] hydrolase